MTTQTGFESIPLKQKADKIKHNFFPPSHILFFSAEPSCLFRKIIYAICSQTRDSAGDLFTNIIFIALKCSEKYIYDLKLLCMLF